MCGGEGGVGGRGEVQIHYTSLTPRIALRHLPPRNVRIYRKPVVGVCAQAYKASALRHGVYYDLVALCERLLI